MEPNEEIGFLGSFGELARQMVRCMTPGTVFMGVGTFLFYRLFWNFTAIGIFMVALLIHECGHAWALIWTGTGFKGLVIHPFGMETQLESPAKNRLDDVIMTYMGPFWGLLLTYILFVLFCLTSSPLLAGITGAIAIINASNLLPFFPLDGGRIVRSIGFSIHPSVGVLFLLTGVIGVPWYFFDLIIGNLIAWCYCLFGLFCTVMCVREEIGRCNPPPAMTPLQTCVVSIIYCVMSGLLLGTFLLMNKVPGAWDALKEFAKT